MEKQMNGTLEKCNVIVLLDGWHQSKGARVELGVALSLEMEIRFYKDMVK